MAENKIKIEGSWFNLLSDEFNKEYFVLIRQSVRKAYTETTVYPKGGLIFNAFNLTPNAELVVLHTGHWTPFEKPNEYTSHVLNFLKRD